MIPPRSVLDSPERLRALADVGLPETGPEQEVFDRHTRLAARILGVPTALISLIGADHQRFASCVGLPEPWSTTRETPLSHSFCQHVVALDAPLIVESARAHALVAENLAIAALGVVGYLGVPLRTVDGHVLGSFCVITPEPRVWTADDVTTLETLAAGVMHELALRAAVRTAEIARAVTEAAYQDVVDSLGEVVFRTDADGRWTLLTPAWTAITGFPVAESLGTVFLEYVHEDDRAGNVAAFVPLVAGHKAVCHHVVRYRTATGAFRWIEVRARATFVDGVVTGTFGTLNDVTDRHADKRALEDRERQLSLAVDVAGLEAWEARLWQPDGADVPVPAPVVHGYGLRRYGLAPTTFAEYLALVHPDDRDAVATMGARVITGGGDGAYEYRLVLREHGVRWRATRLRRVASSDGRPDRLIGVSADTTARREAELAREYRRSLLEATLEATADGVLVVDLGHRVTTVNRRFVELWDCGPSAVEGADADALLACGVATLADADEYRATLARLWDEPEAEYAGLLRFIDGRTYECTSRPQWLDGVVVGRVWGFRDVTARANLEAQLTYQAYHDALTGLANRARFHERLANVLAHATIAGRDPDHVAVLVIDLDGFKHVNDTVGHAAGDDLLVVVAERLLGATRGSDLVARLGGDEFGVILRDVRAMSDLDLVVRRILDVLGTPIAVRGTTTLIGASIGIARGRSAGATDPAPGPAGAGAMDRVDAVIRNADLALYEAKARGRGQAVAYEPTMHTAAVERVSLEAAMRRALDRGEFRLAYQPIVDLATDLMSGVEALVRWHDPERGIVPPSAFIPLAEETGLIVPLGRWVLREAVRQAAEWLALRPGVPPLAVTVNVSGKQLGQADFVGEVAAALRAHPLPPGCLVLELTESAVIHHSDVAVERLRALKHLGVRLAIDDFGTGYSALSYLQQYPFDVLKIDKRFVDHVAGNGQDAALAAAVVALGNALALRTVAEGVETAAQRDALRAMGCPFGQGYLFARPLPAAEISRRLVATSRP